jgi:hypothetical protein
MDGNVIEKYVYIFVIIVVLFKIVANLMPTLTASGNEINATGITLGSLFASNGVLWIVLLAGIFLMVIKNVMGKHK